MPDRVLFVDDEPNVLDGFRRQLRRQFPIETAESGSLGLERVRNNGPYSVIVSDLRMPEMDGIQFLSLVREMAPDSVRMMLTGNADLETAIGAVNEGRIFRFLTKPCPGDALVRALEAGIDQYRLVTAERELLEQTLRGSIKVLTEILALVNPEAFGRSSRIKRWVSMLASRLGIADVWRLETAAMLCQIGCVILPEDAMKRLYKGQVLVGEHARLFARHPTVAYDLLVNIPRMKEVAEIVAYQEKRFDGSGIPEDSRRGEDIPLGARILKVVVDFDMLEAAGKSRGECLSELKHRPGWYDPMVLAAFEAVVGVETGQGDARPVTVLGLEPGMVLAEDIRSVNGMLLVSRGQDVSEPIIERIRGFAGTSGLQEPIFVQVSLRQPAEAGQCS